MMTIIFKQLMFYLHVPRYCISDHHVDLLFLPEIHVLEFPSSEDGKRFGQSLFRKFLGQETPKPCPTPNPRRGTFDCHINLTGAFISGAPSHQRCSSCVLIHCFKRFPSLSLQVKMFHQMAYQSLALCLVLFSDLRLCIILLVSVLGHNFLNFSWIIHPLCPTLLLLLIDRLRHCHHSA